MDSRGKMKPDKRIEGSMNIIETCIASLWLRAKVEMTIPIPNAGTRNTANKNSSRTTEPLIGTPNKKTISKRNRIV